MTPASSLGARRVRADSELTDVAERRRAYAAGVSRQLDEPGGRAGRLLVSRLSRLLLVADRPSDRASWSTSSATGQISRFIENTNDLKRRYSGVTISGPVSHQRRSDVGRQLHALAALGKFRRRELRERSADDGPVPVSRISAGARGSRRKGTWRRISGTARPCWLNYGVPWIAGPDHQRAAGFGDAACRTARAADSPAGQSGFSASAVVDARRFVTGSRLRHAARRRPRDLLLHGARRVSHRSVPPHRLGAQLRLSCPRHSVARGVCPGADAERVQRARTCVHAATTCSTTAGSGAVSNRQRRAHAGEHTVARGVQPVHHHARTRGELECTTRTSARL